MTRITEIRVSNRQQAIPFGKRQVQCLVARVVTDTALGSGHRNCLRVSLHNYNQRSSEGQWLIAFQDGGAWIAIAGDVPQAALLNIGHRLAMAIDSQHQPVAVSPDPDLTAPTFILFEDPNPRKEVFKITADRAPARSPKYGGRVARSHP